MCLLSAVVAWDAAHIECQADSHASPDHPLRAFGRLGIACGIEYAAQAMAVHGALTAEAAGGQPGAAAATPRVGYLAAVRGVQLHAPRLDDVAGPLTIRAERVMGDGQNMVYSFEVLAAAGPLLSGRATVVLDAGMAQRLGAKEFS